MNITVSQNAVNAIPQMVSTLKSMGFPKLAVENCRTGIIAAIMRHFTSMNSKMPGYCHYDIPGRKYRFVFTYRMSPTQNMALITGVSIRKRPVENTGFPVNEEKRNVIRLTKEDLRRYITEAIRTVLTESFIHPMSKPMKIGQYDAIDGAVWDSIQPGLEDKGTIQELCFYVRGNEGIGLFRRCETGRCFYAGIEQISDKKSKWRPLKRKEVPEIILSDFRHCLRRLQMRELRAILASL